MCKETMKAVVVPENVDGSVVVREVPVPAVGHGQALVKIEYSGVCHTDLHVAAGDFGGPYSGPRGRWSCRQGRRGC